MTAVYELVTEDVQIIGGSGSPADGLSGGIFDLSIPDGALVVGSGFLITAVQVESGASTYTWTAVEDLVSHNGADPALGFYLNAPPTVYDGPCPTDSTKWRFIVMTGDAPLQGQIWLATIQTLTTVDVAATVVTVGD
jgi:hypothetical protein